MYKKKRVFLCRCSCLCCSASLRSPCKSPLRSACLKQGIIVVPFLAHFVHYSFFSTCLPERSALESAEADPSSLSQLPEVSSHRGREGGREGLCIEPCSALPLQKVELVLEDIGVHYHASVKNRWEPCANCIHL